MMKLLKQMEKDFASAKEKLRGESLNSVAPEMLRIEHVFYQLRQEISRELKISRMERQLANSSRSLDRILDRITEVVKKEFGFSRFDIVLVDQEQGRVMRRYSKGGFGKTDLEKLGRHGALNVTRDYSLFNKEPYIINDINKDPFKDLALELDVWVHGTFPLYAAKANGEEEVVGFIHGARTKKDFDEGRVLSQDDIVELRRLGDAVTNAIREAKLSYFEQAVMKIQAVIGSTRMGICDPPIETGEENTDSQMDLVLDGIIESLGASYGCIFLRDQNRAQAYAFRNDAGVSLSLDDIVYDSTKGDAGILSRAMTSGLSIIENEADRNRIKMDVKVLNNLFKVHTLIAVPLIETYSVEGVVCKNVIGALVLLNKKDEDGRLIMTDFEGNENGFSTLDRQILESISPHIETVISNTRSHQELRRMSLCDGLTELANHAHFMNNILSLEFKRSERYGTPISLLLMDIDHFKIFNDIFGHQVGDVILKEVALILRQNTRSVDHIARYGGEEFIVLLHNTVLDDAVSYAEKVRERISLGDYVERVKSSDLLDLKEARKRFRAIMEMNDQNIRKAKISLMENHFALDIAKVLELIDSGKLSDARDLIMDSVKVTVSMGLAFYPTPMIASKKDMLTTADMLLLKAKENGRNRVESMRMSDDDE